jgi:o-succinylbenzoate---CoA ligase
MHIPDWLHRRAALHPQRPALLAADTRWDFAELDGQASAMAAVLRELGVQPGMLVATLMGNTPTFVALVHALPRCGATLVPLNTRLTPAELAWQLADSTAFLLLYDAAHEALAHALENSKVRMHPMYGRFANRPYSANRPSVPSPPPPIDLNATHTIIYTSGTTGRPKGALLSYGNHWWSATASALNLGLLPADCWLALLPLFHVGGLSIILRGAMYGIPVVLHERFDPAAANQAIDEQGVTIVSVVATMLQRMLVERNGRPYPPHLRCMLLGGGPAPLPLLEACAAQNIPVVQTYGMTETASQAATLAPSETLRKLGSAGQPLLPLELQIAAAPGEPGEILVRGPMVTAGYHNNAEATAAAFQGGWFHTGDLGRLDEEGFLYVLDRRNDLIISGGENIYPAEVEAALLAHPAVAEAGVIGIPDAQWGQVPVAFVVPGRPELVEGQPTGDELLAFMRERLASYKVPRRIIFVEALPRTAAGKLRRNLLREGILAIDNA